MRRRVSEETKSGSLRGRQREKRNMTEKQNKKEDARQERKRDGGQKEMKEKTEKQTEKEATKREQR